MGMSAEVPPSLGSSSTMRRNDGGGGASSSSSRSVPAVPSACLACRTKHLKCDGRRPCSRCTTSGSDCVYIASRRGYKGPSRKKLPNRSLTLRPARPAASTYTTYGPPAVSINSHAPVSVPSSGSFLPSAFNTTPVFPDFGLDYSIYSETSAPSSHYNLAFDHTYAFSVDALNYAVALPIQNPTYRDRYIESFYYNFHAAHPFVLPKDYLLPLAPGQPTIEPLVAVMRWIGAIFVDTPSTCARLLDYAYRLVYKPDMPKDGFIVQCLLLLILGLDGHRQRDKVHALLVDIRAVSLHIGLNKRWFAEFNGQGMPVLEESWRRTWWDLYIVDAMIAGVHRSTKFSLYEVESDVALPCEEHEFLSGYIPQPLHLEDMDNITFLDDSAGFSSFAYRIQCACYLGKFIQTPTVFGPKDKNLAKFDVLLANWRMHLPTSKSNMLYKDGKFDEMMFQAFMMAHAISILLHQPHSQLDPSLTSYIDACAPTTPAVSSDAFNAHTKHTIRSANELSKLIGHRVSLLTHTHFFAYMVTLAATIHLSEWTLSFVPHNDDNLRQRIRLSIGVLSEYAQVWPAAAHLGMQVKRIAQDIYQVKKQRLLPMHGLGTQGDGLSNVPVVSEAQEIVWDPALAGHSG